MDDDSHDQGIGYCKPPKHTQFVKGKSGNEKGRPRGSKNFSTEVTEELNQRIAVTEGGRSRKVTKRAVIAKQLVNKGAAGDLKALPMLLGQIGQIESKEGGGAQPVLSEEDQQVIKVVYERMKLFKQERGHE
jgi:hypothetical protein